jgi:succinate dehydrogenase/fumarate reductase cytochrome b subunit
MTNKKISTQMIFMGVEFVLAVLTLIPRAAASKACLLGYKALCSFFPISTLGLLALVGLHLFLHYRKPAVEG